MEEKIYELLVTDAGKDLALYIYGEMPLHLIDFYIPGRNETLDEEIKAEIEIKVDGRYLRSEKDLTVSYDINWSDQIDFEIKNNKLIVLATISFLDNELDYPGVRERYNKLKNLIDKTDFAKITDSLFTILKDVEIVINEQYELIPESVTEKHKCKKHIFPGDVFDSDETLYSAWIEIEIRFDILDRSLYAPPLLSTEGKGQGGKGGYLYEERKRTTMIGK